MSIRRPASLPERLARALMLAQPSVIRRPVVEAGARVLVGFDAAAYASLTR